MTTISEDQLDFLKEVFNLGVGRAAASLSELANNKYEVILTLPHLQIFSMEEMVEYLNKENNGHITCVSQKYTGKFAGTANMIYSQEAIIKLVGLMLGTNIPNELLSELEIDALMEVGNILNNACLSALSKMFQDEIETSLPQIFTGVAADYFKQKGTNSQLQIAFLSSEFKIQEENIKGYISLSIETDKMQNLLDLIDKYNNEL